MRKDGTAGDDVLRTDSDYKDVRGHGGNDILYVETAGGAAHGGAGDDTLYGGGDGRAQAHLYGGRGDDTIYMSASDRVAPHGSHAWGNEGHDRFIFSDVAGGSSRVVGRIDDFDYTRDEIWIDDEKIDLKNPPEYLRIVEYKGQPWILIDDRILYALEGARQTLGPEYSPSEEVHFIDWPKEWEHGVPRSADIAYEDFADFFPADQLTIPEDQLKRVAGDNGANELSGTSGNDYVWGGDGADTLHGGAGDDLINGGEGYDTLYGGAGNDSLAGGLDQDVIYGGDGDDIAFGGSGRDQIYGDAGQDTLYGNGENDLIDGGEGDDLIYGGRGNDVMIGGEGADSLYGGDGYDVLIAGSLNGRSTPSHATTESEDLGDLPRPHNLLDGGKGKDILFAAEGEFTNMTGGDGHDSFIAAKDAQITISDFKMGTDKLDISGMIEDDTDPLSLFTSVDRGDGSGIRDMLMSLPGGTSIVLQNLGSVNPSDFAGSLVNNPVAPDPMDYVHTFHHAGPPDLGAPHRPHEDHPREPHEDDKDPKDPKDADGEGGSCFVATASYGNAAHPDVAWLRAFRDDVLLPHPIGRAFIRFYWQVGPVLAKLVRHDGASGRVMRRALGAIVATARR